MTKGRQVQAVRDWKAVELELSKILTQPYGERHETKQKCQMCGYSLHRLDWNTACYMIICDNSRCLRFRVPVGTEPKERSGGSRGRQS